jgi:hypothetical protein
MGKVTVILLCIDGINEEIWDMASIYRTKKNLAPLAHIPESESIYLPRTVNIHSSILSLRIALPL